MSSYESLSQRLTVAAALLDAAAADVRDLSLEPSQEHIRRIGEALAHLFEVQRGIFAVRPDLQPRFLSEQSPMPEADGRLTEVLAEAYRLADSKQTTEAVASLREFAATEASQRHAGIAVFEANRLERALRK